MTDGRYTVGLYTLGCKVSQYETEAVGELFEKRGFCIRPFGEVCDAYVINTCTVTEESDRKSRQFIRRAVRKNPDAVVAVMGCYSQRAHAEIARIDGVCVIVGTEDKLSVVGSVEKLLSQMRRDKMISVGDLSCAKFEDMTVTRAPRTRAYVKIEDGCESKCSYCAIAPARGPVRSKKPLDVIAEVEGLAKGGTREVVLTGIETGSYGKDLKCGYGLAELLVELDARGSCERIRLGSLAPELMGRDFTDKVGGLRILAPHFHISVQSGSDRILRLMKRRYSASRAKENIERLREAFPGAMFTTDLMVGFPGETEDDFEQTCNFVREIGFLDAHVFAYSKRAGTPAAEYEGQIPESVKHERSERLIALKNDVRDKLLDAVVLAGKPLSCILEAERDGVYSAHSESFIEVSVNAPKGMQGEIVSVIPKSHKNGIIYGDLI